MTGKHNGTDPREAAIKGFIGIAPQDEVEGMLAAQIIAAHGAVMDCYRAAAEGSAGSARCDDLVMADKLARTFALLVATQRRYRRKAPRTITVDYVHVDPDAPALAPPKRAAHGAGKK